jgi:hypothetical protein
MFLFTVFVMFMMLSYMPVSPPETLGTAQARLASEVAEKTVAVAEAERALKSASPDDRADARGRLADARGRLKDATEDLEGVKAVTAKVGDEADWKESLSAEMKSSDINLNLGNKKLEEKLRHKLQNPELALYKLQQTFYKFSFLLVPLSIPFVALLFLWKRGFTFYDHGVFVLYSLTFMSLLAMVTAVVARFGAPWGALMGGLVPFIIPTHMFFQLKGAYGLRAFSALWRTFFLLIFCFIVLVLFGLAIVALGLV